MYCQIRQNRLAIWLIPVGNLVNTGWQFGQYRLAIWPIPVGDMANTGEGTFSKIWAVLRSKSGILKSWGVLELCLDMGSRIKKIRFWLQKCPFNHHVVHTILPSPPIPYSSLSVCLSISAPLYVSYIWVAP